MHPKKKKQIADKLFSVFAITALIFLISMPAPLIIEIISNHTGWNPPEALETAIPWVFAISGIITFFMALGHAILEHTTVWDISIVLDHPAVRTAIKHHLKDAERELENLVRDAVILVENAERAGNLRIENEVRNQLLAHIATMNIMRGSGLTSLDQIDVDFPREPKMNRALADLREAELADRATETENAENTDITSTERTDRRG